MILFFSGTGNSAYAAVQIGREINDEVIDLFERIRSHDFTDIHSDSAWVVVVPTYAWRIPRIVQEWLENTNLLGSREIYFVMTCGGSIGDAGRYLEKLCDKKKLNYMGCIAVKMPENYIAMFSVPERERALEIIGQADVVIGDAALMIKNNRVFPKSVIRFPDKANSGFINALFYPMFVHAKKFHVTDACVSCGKCVKVCPLNNIHLAEGKPVWGKNCTHCMACINRCPSESIEYGEHSKGMPRYTCPKTH